MTGRSRRWLELPYPGSHHFVHRSMVALFDRDAPNGAIALATPGSSFRGASFPRKDIRGQLGPIIGPGLFLLSAGLWLSSLPQIHPARQADIGLVSVLPPQFFVSLAVMLAGYAWSLRLRPLPAPILFAYNVLFIFTVRGTPQIVYPTVRYAWIYKHVGIVDYIMRHGSVNRQIATLGIYHNWPGFFALGALYTQAAGFVSALSFAGWLPILMNLLFLGALFLIYRNESRDERLLWLAVWFFGLANWLGQDIFAPQAVAYFLFLCVIGICRHWFRGGIPVWHWNMVAARATTGRLAARLDRGIGHERVGGRRDRYESGALLTVLMIMAYAIVSSHQLTPFMTLGAIIALVLIGRCDRYWLPPLLAGMITLWLLWPAWPFVSTNTTLLFGSLLSLTGNFQASLKNTSAVPVGQQIVAYVARASVFFFVILAVVGGWMRVRLGQWKPAMAVLVVAPLPWLALTAYGTEGVFRVYYFGLPFLAFYAASALFPSSKRGRSVAATLAVFAISGVLCAGLLVTYYGQDRMNYIPRDEIAAVSHVTNISPPGSLLVTGPNDPIYYRNYEHFAYQELTYIFATRRPGSHPLHVILKLMRAPHTSAYLMFTSTSYQNLRLTGVLNPQVFLMLRREAFRSPYLRMIYRNPNAVIFQLRGPLRRSRG